MPPKRGPLSSYNIATIQPLAKPLREEDKFSTHPPQQRRKESGKFQIPENPNLPHFAHVDEQLKQEERSPEDVHPKRKTSDEDFIRQWCRERAVNIHQYGNMIVSQFGVFRYLPYCVRDFIESPLIAFMKHKTTVLEKGTVIPQKTDIEREIIRIALEKDATHLVLSEVANLLERDFDQEARKLCDIFIQWIDLPPVVTYLRQHNIAPLDMKNRVHDGFMRLEEEREKKYEEVVENAIAEANETLDNEEE